ncbi:MAG: glycosyltransferase family 4 protein, partial [Proteobacteria bacterium]|nr:glycosyltransferase family 4 protein [Pseudomonadota bacterium]
MKNILFVHQSADLYGSDKVLFDLVTSLDKKKFHPILLLPSKGPLLNKLLNNNIETYVVKLTRLSRATLSVKGIITLPFDILKSLRMFNQILKNRRIDIVHSNTLATLTGAFWAKCNKVPHLWHVHEMISRPRIVLWGYLFLLYFFADYIVCNSHATRKLLTDNQSFLIPKSYVIWNGLKQSEKIDNEKVNKLRRSLHLGEKDLLIVLMGRINGWKGQPLFIDAANKLWKKGLRNIHFLMVGSPPIGQDHFKK